jgi:adenylate kinase family enzyme
MRISLIGPSASGKTTLARKIATRYGLKNFNLDNLLFRKVNNKKRISVSKEESLVIIDKISSGKNWVIEGLHPFDLIFERADLIIWLKPSFLTCIYRQWKRFFTDINQRRDYGFISNVKLSIYIFRQFFEEPNYITDPKGTWIKSVEKRTFRFKEKLIIFSGSSKFDYFEEAINYNLKRMF